MNAALPHADRLAHHPPFRHDINGLRALAICLVVAFHACPGGVPGGFVGVDVFFVISGYLISGIVLRDLGSGAFDFLLFYGRRIVRIFPALLVVLAATCAFGWISLYSFEYERLGKHVVAALGFASNVVLWNEAGYFDASASQKPLMHLWSLAIEEQFYLLFPISMWAAGKVRMRHGPVILGALLLSFGVNVVRSAGDPVADFFDPAARAWEILAGSLLAAHQLPGEGAPGVAARMRRWQASPSLTNIVSAVGLLLVIGSAFALHDTLRFPGWYALLPTTGTAMMIWAGPGSVVGRLLSRRFAAGLGRVSYPLYLWHWPILSFAAILQPGGPHSLVMAACVGGALALACLTHVAVERPVAAMRPQRWRKGLVALPTVLLAFFGFTAFSAAGFPMRPVSVDAPVDSSPANNANLAPGCDVEPSLQAAYAHCQHDSRGPARFALLGDSKAASLSPGLFSNAARDGYWLLIGGYMKGGSTPVPVLSDAPEFHSHQASLRPALAAIAADKAVRVVVLATATRSLFGLLKDDSIAALADSDEYPAALDGLDRAVTYLVVAGKKVVLLVDNPTFRAPLLCVSRTTSVPWVDRALNLAPGISSCEISRSDQLRMSARYRTLLETVVARHPDAAFMFDSLDALCDPATTMCSAMDGSHHLYSYSDHISPFAAHKIARGLVPFVDAVARR